MRLREIMTRDVEVVRPEDSIADAARKMEDLNVGALPVCDNGRLVGVLTDRDVTVRATAEGANPRTHSVGDTMTRDLVYCTEDQDVSDAEELMRTRQIRRLPILGSDQRLVGIVSLGDLATDDEDSRRSGRILEGVSEPSEPDR